MYKRKKREEREAGETKAERKVWELVRRKRKNGRGVNECKNVGWTS